MDQTRAVSLVAGGDCFSSLLLLDDQARSRIHPDDLPAVCQRYQHGWPLLCFRYGGQESGYEVLDDGQIRVRVRGAVVEPIPAPLFRRGDRVFAHPKQSVGVVREVVWHLKRGCVYYSLEFDGRRSGRWYFDSDLALPGNAESAAAPDPAT